MCCGTCSEASVVEASKEEEEHTSEGANQSGKHLQKAIRIVQSSGRLHLATHVQSQKDQNKNCKGNCKG